MKLIVETNDDVNTLVESAGNGSKNYYIEGRFMTANEANKNGRMYPKSIMENALRGYQGVIQSKRAMGELGHPPGPQINLDRVSHLIESLKMQGNYCVGRAKLLDTPMGKIAKNLIDEGVKLGVSSRGLGSIKSTSNGINEVQNDFRLSTIDIVSDPSGPGCFVNGIMESTEWFVTSDGRLEEKTIEFLKKEKITEERKVKAFACFMEALSTGRY